MNKNLVCALVALSLTFCLSKAWAADHVKQDRPVDAFTSIELKGNYKVFLVQGQENSLTLEGDPAVLADIRTEVKNGRLIIDTKPKLFCWGRDQATVYITAKEVVNLGISGSSTVVGAGVFKTDKLDIDISGSGSVTMEVAAREVECDIAGSGDIELKGKADNMGIDIAGAGDVNAMGLEAKSATVEIAGSGDAQVAASEKLEATIMGSGDIVYRGAPQILRSNIAGSGNIRKAK